MALRLFRVAFLSSLSVVIPSFAAPALAATWQTGVNYGGSTNMNLYVPDNVDASPGIVVALHSCGNQYESDSQNYAQSSADQYGFIIIQPTNGSPDCWTANAGQDGEKPDIIAMVNYVLENHDADAERVFAVGASSGACMTLALMATHPDVFAAGATLAGVPYGAWTGGANCSICNQPAATMSEDAWGNLVRTNAPDGFDGPWPRIQLWHGTGDTTLVSGWLAEAEKQWKNVHALSGAGASAEAPSGWTRSEYTKDGTVVLQVNSGAGKDHYLPDDVPQAEYITFFGLDMDPPSGETSGEPVTSAPTTDTTSGEVTSEPVTNTDTAPNTSSADTSAPQTTSATPQTTSMSPSTAASSSTSGPTPVDPSSTSPVTSPAVTTTSAATNPSTTESATTAPPVSTVDNDEAGCQCQLGAAGQPVGAVAGFVAAALATLLRRRRRVA